MHVRKHPQCTLGSTQRTRSDSPKLHVRRNKLHVRKHSKFTPGSTQNARPEAPNMHSQKQSKCTFGSTQNALSEALKIHVRKRILVYFQSICCAFTFRNFLQPSFRVFPHLLDRRLPNMRLTNADIGGGRVLPWVKKCENMKISNLVKKRLQIAS